MCYNCCILFRFSYFSLNKLRSLFAYFVLCNFAFVIRAIFCAVITGHFIYVQFFCFCHTQKPCFLCEFSPDWRPLFSLKLSFCVIGIVEHWAIFFLFAFFTKKKMYHLYRLILYSFESIFFLCVFWKRILRINIGQKKHLHLFWIMKIKQTMPVQTTETNPNGPFIFFYSIFLKIMNHKKGNEKWRERESKKKTNK